MVAEWLHGPGRWIAVSCLGGAVALWAGCTSADSSSPEQNPKLRVEVPNTDTAKALSEDATRQLLIEAEVRRVIDQQNAARPQRPPKNAAPTGLAEAPKPVADAVPPVPALPGPEGTAEAPGPVIPPLCEVRLPALTNPAMADQLISVDFNAVDIRIVLKTISELTGLNFLVDDNVRGTVTLLSPTKIRLGEVYKVMESILEVKGYAAVPSGNVIKIVPSATAIKSPMGIYVGSDAAAIPENDTMRNQLVPLRYATASEIASLISPMLSSADRVTSYPQTNTLLITDTSAKVRRAALVIQALDLPGTKTETSVIQLKHASATELSSQLQDILERDSSAGGKGAAAPAAAPGGMRAFKVIADTRTNSLIIQAGARTMQTVEDLVARLDVERPVEAGNIHVIYMENAEATDVAKSLTSVLDASIKASGGKGGTPVQLTADASTNSLIVISSPEEFNVVQGIVGKLDIPREQVLVEMRIIEVSGDALRDIGTDLSTLDPPSESNARGFGATNFGLRNELATGALQGLGVGMFKQIGNTVQIGALLKLLEGRTGVNILSTPQILTSNHHEATIVVAENIPYVKDSRVTESDPQSPTVIKTFDYRDVGITLKITPHVGAGGMVRMDIASEFSKLIEGAPGTSADTPTTAKRQATTTVAVADGATVVIGGLIRDDKQVSTTKVPWVGDIPLLGYLFKRERTTVLKTNLLLFITPHTLPSQPSVAAASYSNPPPPGDAR